MENKTFYFVIAGIVIVAVLYAILAIIKSFQSYYLKRKLIESGKYDEKSKMFFKENKFNKLAFLKWGILILSVSIGLICIAFIPWITPQSPDNFNLADNNYVLATNLNSPFAYGLILFFVAIGFLVYYQIVKKNVEKREG